MTVVDTALLPAKLEAARALRRRFSGCCAEFAESEVTADTVAAAMARHLAAITMAELPAAAQVIWQARVARPLKADTAKPLAERTTNAIRSWPSQRASDLRNALIEIEAILADTENELAHEVIYTEISRTYS